MTKLPQIINARTPKQFRKQYTEKFGKPPSKAIIKLMRLEKRHGYK